MYVDLTFSTTLTKTDFVLVNMVLIFLFHLVHFVGYVILFNALQKVMPHALLMMVWPYRSVAFDRTE
jgi:hypothetical protein